MNQQLVESIAQIVLAMSAEERELFDRRVSQMASSSNGNGANGNGKINRDDTPSKDAQIAQIAQQMKEFEEQHAMPLSPLPDEQWRI